MPFCYHNGEFQIRILYLTNKVRKVKIEMKPVVVAKKPFQNSAPNYN